MLITINQGANTMKLSRELTASLQTELGTYRTALYLQEQGYTLLEALQALVWPK